MGKCFLHGNGCGSQNFAVQAYASEADLPAAAKANTIAVFTETPMTSYIFNPVETAEPVEGMVWILTGLSSAVAFSVTKKNPIMVYPLSVKQYVGGVWVDRTAKSYQNGEWVSWWNGELYDKGNEFESVTGGWSAKAWASNAAFSANGKAPTLTKNADSMSISLSVNNAKASGAIDVEKDIDLTRFSRLVVSFPSVKFTGTYSSSQGKGASVSVNVVPRDASTFNEGAVAKTTVYKETTYSVTDTTIEVDLSDVTGTYDIVVGLTVNSSSSATASAEMTKAKLS